MDKTNPRVMKCFESFYSSVGALVAEKSPVDQLFPGLKSGKLIKNMASFKIKYNQVFNSPGI